MHQGWIEGLRRHSTAVEPLVDDALHTALFVSQKPPRPTSSGCVCRSEPHVAVRSGLCQGFRQLSQVGLDRPRWPCSYSNSITYRKYSGRLSLDQTK